MRSLLLLPAVLLAACATGAASVPAEGVATLVRGEPLTIPEAQAVSLATVLESPAEYTGRPVRLHGTAEKVCQKKGCWIVLADEGVEGVRVTMKDYGFFVPVDCAGKKVALEGEVTLKTVSVEEQAHFAEDEGRAVDPATLEAKQVVAVVARGVEVYQ